MCGRYTITQTPEELAYLLGLDLQDLQGLVPRYNVAPTQIVPVIRNEANAGIHLAGLRWGFLPSWSHEPGTGYVNARWETANQKTAFATACDSRRCLFLANGFIEWETISGKKQPRWFRPIDEQIFALAGLWEPSPPSLPGVVGTATILTQAANEDVVPFHDRMPVMLKFDQFQAWLNPEHKWHQASAGFTISPPKGTWHQQAVRPALNSSRRDCAEDLQPVRANLFDD